ncbi:lipid asymmetry maintenance protein MlaB [Undibacterium sp.]|uniref:STAS domain-containing protein n=1 Tax=Undibacterium sp. TaxID=1914977 RepID=UPI0037539FAF
MESYTVSGELSIYTASSEKQSLFAFLQSADELEVNLSQVSEFDTAGLQVLIVLKQAAVQHQKTLRYVMHSKAVLDVLEMTHMTGIFGDQVVLT